MAHTIKPAEAAAKLTMAMALDFDNIKVSVENGKAFDALGNVQSVMIQADSNGAHVSLVLHHDKQWHCSYGGQGPGKASTLQKWMVKFLQKHGYID